MLFISNSCNLRGAWPGQLLVAGARMPPLWRAGAMGAPFPSHKTRLRTKGLFCEGANDKKSVIFPFLGAPGVLG
jgi:hypothetical protein